MADVTAKLAEVVAFLNGSAPLDGVWFGDPHPTERGDFWWRKHLLAAYEQAQAEPVAWLRDFWGPDCGPYYEIHKSADMTWRSKDGWTPLFAAPVAQAATPAPAEPLWYDFTLDEVKARLQCLNVDDLRGLVVSLLIALRIERKALAATPAPVPAGFALVPLRMNQAMRDVTDEEGWTWEDLLDAAEAIDEPTYNELAATPAPAQNLPPLPEAITRAIEAYGNARADHELDPSGATLKECGDTLVEAIKTIRAALAATPAAPQPDAEQLRLAGLTLIGLAEHDQHCEAFDLDDEGKHQACTCGFDGAIAVITQAGKTATPAPAPTKAQEALKLIATASPGEHAFEYMRGIARAAMAATPAPAEREAALAAGMQMGNSLGISSPHAIRIIAAYELGLVPSGAATPAPAPHPDTADAERYRWLRNEADYLRIPEGSPQVLMTDEWGVPVSIGLDAYPRGKDLDAAIDAARADQGKEASK